MAANSVCVNQSKTQFYEFLWRTIMARKRVSVTDESTSGRNQNFHDNYNGANMTRQQFVREINKGNYPKYHVRNVNRLDTPVSNPDSSEKNNLG